MIKCPTCGIQVPDTTNYCPQCGWNLKRQAPKQWKRPPVKERAISNINLVVAAIAVTLACNIPLMALMNEAGDPFPLVFAELIGPLSGAMFLGLIILLILELLGTRIPALDRDWTLIVTWKQAWQRFNIPVGLFLSFAMGWWWSLTIVAIIMIFAWGFGLVFFILIFLSPVLALANWALGWIYAFFNAIVSRFYMIVPFFPREEDRQKVEEFLKDTYERLRKKS